MRKLIAIAALAGLACLYGLSLAAGGTVTVVKIGDTVTLLDGSGDGQDTVGTYPADAYNCCEFPSDSVVRLHAGADPAYFTGDGPADTTRPVNILGASRVIVQIVACDTCTYLRFKPVFQFVGDTSSTWASFTINSAGDFGTFNIMPDTTGRAPLEKHWSTQSWMYANTNGAIRNIAFLPFTGSDPHGTASPASGEDKVDRNRIVIPWMRVILTTYPPDSSAWTGSWNFGGTARVRVFVERDEIGEKWSTLDFDGGNPETP